MDGVVKKLYGDLSFSDYFKAVGQQGKSWVAYHGDVNTNQAGLVSNLWNGSASAWKMDQTVVGAPPTLQTLSSGVVGIIPEPMEAAAKAFFDRLNVTDKTSAVAGVGGNPMEANPWCFFVPETSQFVCYLESTIQEVQPLFWPEDGAYFDEFGKRMWKLMVYGMLCCAFLFVVRYIHEEIIMGCLFKQRHASPYFG